MATSYDKGRTKTDQPRRVPIHPTLAAILAEWKLGGWAERIGRHPEPDDLVVPLSPEERQLGQRTNPRAGAMRNKSDSYKRIVKDLAALGLRHRRGHDLRRTFITLAQVDGARRDILERVTHNPTSGAAIDLYTSYPWTSLCEEVAKLKISRAPRTQVVQMPPPAAGELEPSTELTPEFTPAETKLLKFIRKSVEAPGVEDALGDRALPDWMGFLDRRSGGGVARRCSMPLRGHQIQDDA